MYIFPRGGHTGGLPCLDLGVLVRRLERGDFVERNKEVRRLTNSRGSVSEEGGIFFRAAFIFLNYFKLFLLGREVKTRTRVLLS